MLIDYVLLMNVTIDHYLIEINYFHYLLLNDEDVVNKKRNYLVMKRFYLMIYRDVLIYYLIILLFD